MPWLEFSFVIFWGEIMLLFGGEVQFLLKIVLETFSIILCLEISPTGFNVTYSQVNVNKIAALEPSPMVCHAGSTCMPLTLDVANMP